MGTSRKLTRICRHWLYYSSCGDGLNGYGWMSLRRSYSAWRHTVTLFPRDGRVIACVVLSSLPLPFLFPFLTLHTRTVRLSLSLSLSLLLSLPLCTSLLPPSVSVPPSRSFPSRSPLPPFLHGIAWHDMTWHGMMSNQDHLEGRLTQHRQQQTVWIFSLQIVGSAVSVMLHGWTQRFTHNVHAHVF